MLSQKLYYITQSGIDYAMSNDLAAAPASWPNGNDYTISVANNQGGTDTANIVITVSFTLPDTYEVTSVATLNGKSKTITTTVVSGKITNWS